MEFKEHTADMLKRFGMNIRHIREARGLSQERLAEMVGYKSRTSINKIEMGKTDIGQKTIARIAEALGVTSADLMDGYNPQKKQEVAAEAADLSDVKANFIKSVKEMTDEQIMLLQAVVDQVLRENGMR